MKCNTSNACIKHCAALLVVLSLFAAGLGRCEESQQNTMCEKQFNDALQKWLAYLENETQFSFSSNPHDYMDNDEFQEIMSLGPKALPYIVVKIDAPHHTLVEACLTIAFRKITKLHFTKEERSEYASKKDAYVYWWKTRRAQTGLEFHKRYWFWASKVDGEPKGWEALADNNGNIYTKELKEGSEFESYRSLLSLGIAALPYAFDVVRNEGRLDLLDAIDYWTNNRPRDLFDKQEVKTTKREFYLEWWEENKDAWILPALPSDE